MLRVLAVLGWLLCVPVAAWAADPQIAIFDDDDPVPAGALYTYSLRIDNQAPDNAVNTRLTVVVPAGAVFVSAAPASANCAPSAANSVDCNLGTVAGNSSDARDITLTWRATGPGPATIGATATVAADNDANPANNTRLQDTTVVAGANLVLAKLGTPDAVVGGATVSWALTARNLGPNAAGGMVLTDHLPPDVSFVSASGAGWSCAHVAGIVTCSRSGPLAVGAAAPVLTLVGRVQASGGTVTNSASIAPAAVGGVPDPDSADNTALANTTVLPGADVQVPQKSVASGLPATAGSSVIFTVQARNAGPAAATDVVVTDPLPTGWVFQSASGPNWACSHEAGTVRCTRAVLPAGAQEDISIVARAPANADIAPGGSTFTNTALISAATADPEPGNNSGSIDVPVSRDGADLRLSKLKTPNPVALGALMTSTLSVFNQGPRRATGPLRVVDLLQGESFVSAAGSGWTCDASAAPVVVCTHANSGGLAVRASLPDLLLTTRADSPGGVSNTACTGSSVPAGVAAALASPPVEGDPNTANDCASAGAVSTTVRPDLSLTKVTRTPLGGDKRLSNLEDSVTYTLVVRNVSPDAQDATGVTLSDNLPGWITGRSTAPAITITPSAGSTAVLACSTDLAIGRVSCRQTAGRLAPGEQITVALTVNRPLREGSYVNTATVGNTNEGDPNLANNVASDTVTIAPMADVVMAGKTVNPGALRAGEFAVYVLSFRNDGPSPAVGVRVRDSFSFAPGDAGLVITELVSSKAGSSCDAAAGSRLTPAAPAFECSIGTLANGETQTITLRVRPAFQPGNPADVRTVQNRVRIDAVTAESPTGSDNGNNEQQATLQVQPALLDLLVNKTDRDAGVVLDPVAYTDGATFLGYRISVSNTGPSYATGVRISEQMTPPPGKRVRFVCDVAAFGSSTCNPVPLCTGAGSTSAPGAPLPAFTCGLPAGDATTGAGAGELAVGATKAIFLRYEVLDPAEPTGDVFAAASTVSANEPDTLGGNNVATETTTTRQRVAIVTTKTASNPSPALREPFNWTLRVRNDGPGHALRIHLSDTLPAGVEVLGPLPITWATSAPAATGNCTLTGRELRCEMGALQAGGTATVVLPVRVTAYPAGGVLTNTATVDVSPDVLGAVDLPGGNHIGSSTVTVQRASLAGTVFEDRLRSPVANAGTLQPAEPRLAGVSLRLRGTDAFGNAVDRTTQTDADGSYRFGDLSPSSPAGYTVTQAQPAGLDNGPALPPTSGVAAPSAGGTYSRGGRTGDSSYSAIVLGAATEALNYDFPELRQPSLGGVVYVDLNGSGRFDSGDTPIEGATVRLLDAASGALVANTTSNASGAYGFSGLDPALLYTLEQALPAAPAGLVNGPVNPGLVGAAACATGCTAQPSATPTGADRIAGIDLSGGLDGSGFDFGERPSSFISGLVWLDANRDGLLDPAETVRLAGVELRLVAGNDCAAPARATLTTDAEGAYRFDGVAALQDYRVCQTQPSGYGTGSAGGTAGLNHINVPALPLAGSTGNHFGETLASLAGSVYQDSGAGTPANFNNGRRDAGEVGIANVPVTLSGTDARGAAVNRSVLTDAGGNFRFDDLLAPDGSGYTLAQGTIPPASGTYLDGLETAGTAGGATTTNDRIAAITLPAGAQAGGYLFGELPVAAISGTVYIDRNRNGELDAAPADGRLGGVTLRLVQGADCASGTVLQTTTTAADGGYGFAGAPVGSALRICQQQPAGYGNGVPNPGTAAVSPGPDEIVISSLPATGSAGNHFGERLGRLAGSVFVDHSAATPASNDNGRRDAGEAGIAGVVVTLGGRDFSGAAVNRTATTDVNGDFAFDDLLQSDAGGYTLSEGSIPAGAGVFNDGSDAAGSAGGAVDSGADRISAIVLGAGVQAGGYLFGERPASDISGTVYVDRNRNGVLDAQPTDGRLAGVEIRLVAGSDCSAPALARTTTDANGDYRFSRVSAGLSVTLCQTQPVGYADGAVNPGADAGSTAANRIELPDLAAGGSPGHHFGERVGSLAGRVYLDLNHDGIRQAGEPGIAGVGITLSGNDASGAALNRTVVTDAQGAFRFDDLLAAGPAGYTLTEQAAQPVVGGLATLDGRSSVGRMANAPAGTALGTAGSVGSTPSTISGIALPAGADGSDYFFGELLPGTLSGLVFLDPDNDGVRTAPGEAGLPGVTLVLSGTDDTGAAVNRSVQTGADGRYSFGELRPGSYTVTQPSQPAGTRNGQTVAGLSNGAPSGSATPLAVLPSAISGIVLTGSGAVASGHNFAEIPNSSAVQGRVWLDANHNGSLDASEVGIAAVRIELSGSDIAGRAVARDTLTDAEGRFGFADLPPGRYSLLQPAQPAGTVNGRTLPGSSGGTATAVAVTPSSISGIPLAAGQTSGNHLFGEVPGAGIAGRVFVDNNDNGRVDGTEAGLPGVTLVLTGTDDLGNTVNLTLTTGPDGSFRFADLRPGSYTLTQPMQPVGTVNGQTVPGSSGGTATAPGVAPSAISGIVLGPGAAASGNLFGELAESPDLRVHKAALEPRFTVGFVGHYRISVRNGGEAPSRGSITVGDRLPPGLSLAAAPSGSGWACTGAPGDTRFSCSSSAVINPGAAAADISFAVRVAAAAAANGSVDNRVWVEGGGEIEARAPGAGERAAIDADSAAGLPLCSSPAAHNACRTSTAVQLAASVSGTVWLDQGSSPRLLDSGDRRLPGWVVEVVDAAGSRIVGQARTAADGSWRVADLMPGEPLAVRFREPASGIVFGWPVNGETAPGSSGVGCDAQAAAAGRASSCVAAGDNPALAVVLAPGQELPQQSLPVDPSGIVYDSGTRTPIGGATVSIEPVGACAGWNPGTGLVGATLGGYALDGGRASMTVGPDGFYQFLFGTGAPATCTFALTVIPPPGSGYTAPSAAIPPAAAPLVPSGGAGSTFAVQPQAGVPTGPVGPATTYHLSLVSGSAGASVIHNHIPLDPALPGAIAISKTGDRARAEVGDSVRYTITVAVSSGALPRQTTVVDRLPAGLSYIPGTAMVGDVPIADPQGGLGPRLAFHLGPMPASRQLVLRYRVRVGVGALQGDGINRARAHACGVPAGCVDANGAPLPGSVATAEAAHRVLIGGGVFTTEACVLGKIFVDCNGNHVQDREELGIPGVRLVMQDGTTLISDSEGKYSVCGVPPRSAVLKVDPLTLPRGARLTTSSNRNLGDAGSLWLDLKNGELHRADFVEGSCSNTVLEQTKARRAQGEVRAPEPEKKGGPALRFDSKAHGLTPLTAPQQGTDGANQRAPRPRPPVPPPPGPVQDEMNVPSTELPMNSPPPRGRDSGTAPDAGVRHGAR